jgi:hypothetical protein
MFDIGVANQFVPVTDRPQYKRYLRVPENTDNITVCSRIGDDTMNALISELLPTFSKTVSSKVLN